MVYRFPVWSGELFGRKATIEVLAGHPNGPVVTCVAGSAATVGMHTAHPTAEKWSEGTPFALLWDLA